jgi:long-subunit fatty acid transport protein
MQFRRTLLLLMILCLVLPLRAQEGNKGGRAGAQFLKIGVAARATGMGEAFVAVANDVSACFYNPSGLTQVKAPQAMFSNIRWPAEIAYNYAAFALPLEFLDGTLGVHAASLSTGDMIVRTPLRPEGTGQTFRAANYDLGISFARNLTDHFSFGVTMKGISEHAYGLSASGWAVDLASMYETGFGSFRFGWILSNFGPDMKYIDEAFALPAVMTFGVAAEAFDNDFHRLTIAVQANRPNDNAERGSVGAEYRVRNVFALRVGYKVNYDVEKLSLGAGLRINVEPVGTVLFDYSFSDMTELLVAHRITIGIEL